MMHQQGGHNPPCDCNINSRKEICKIIDNSQPAILQWGSINMKLLLAVNSLQVLFIEAYLAKNVNQYRIWKDDFSCEIFLT